MCIEILTDGISGEMARLFEYPDLVIESASLTDLT